MQAFNNSTKTFYVYMYTAMLGIKSVITFPADFTSLSLNKPATNQCWADRCRPKKGCD